MTDSAFEAFLTGALEAAGLGRPRSWSRRLHRRRSSFRLDHVLVQLDDGADLSLVCKATGARALAPGSRDRKPVWRHHPGREAWCYEHLLAGSSLGTPRWYGTEPDRRWLLLEDVVDAVPLTETADPAAWEGAAAELARLHATTPVPTGTSPLADLGAHTVERSWVAAVAAAPWERVRPLVERRPAVERAVEVLAAAEPVVVHGECFATNVLHAAAGRRVALVDWEHAGIGSGAVDLAALTAGWPQERAEELVEVYGRTRGLGAAGRRDVRREWAAARVVGAVHRLADSEGRAPLEHAHDWWSELGEAALHLHEEDRCPSPSP